MLTGIYPARNSHEQAASAQIPAARNDSDGATFQAAVRRGRAPGEVKSTTSGEFTSPGAHLMGANLQGRGPCRAAKPHSRYTSTRAHPPGRETLQARNLTGAKLIRADPYWARKLAGARTLAGAEPRPARDLAGAGPRRARDLAGARWPRDAPVPAGWKTRHQLLAGWRRRAPAPRADRGKLGRRPRTCPTGAGGSDVSPQKSGRVRRRLRWAGGRPVRTGILCGYGSARHEWRQRSRSAPGPVAAVAQPRDFPSSTWERDYMRARQWGYEAGAAWPPLTGEVGT